jgi:mRNA-degrading endonuclease RelE of RelBE toxin-antitoxin system
VAFDIEFVGNGSADLKKQRVFDQRQITDAIEDSLRHQPTVSSRNRKCLTDVSPSFEHVPPIWELRVDEFRVFYDVDEEARIIFIRAIRRKEYANDGGHYMKRIEFDQLPPDFAALVAASQREKVVIARDGKPYALIVGVEFKDQEDLQVETSPEFWEMIRQRRAETNMIPLEEIVARLKAEEDAAVHGATAKAANQSIP